MFKNLSEKDFVALRGPLESGRQAPASLGGAMLIMIFCQGLWVFLSHYIGGDSILPFTDELVAIHLWVSVILVGLTILFLFPYFYKNYQKSQYLLSILTVQNTGALSIYILALLTIGTSLPDDYHLEPVMTYIYITIGVALLLFIVTCIRFYILLLKGKYRRGSSKDQLRRTVERKLNMSAIVAGSVGFGFIIQHLLRNIGFMDYGDLLIVALALLIFYTMIFILPEQLVILYCKYRFKSFNFESNGKYLIPLQETQEDETSSLKK